MATLKELAQFNQDKPTLRELSEQGRVAGPRLDLGGSNRLFAAKTAALSDDPTQAVNTFDVINSELEEGQQSGQSAGSSEVADTILSQRNQQQNQESREALVDYLADPSVSDNEKQNAAQQLSDMDQEQYSINKHVQTNALAEDNEDQGMEETPETEFTRFSIAEMLETDQEWRREQQSLLNREARKSDTGSITAWADIFEHMVPFMESKDAGDILSRLKEGDASAYAESFTLLGNAKMSMRDMLKSVPVDERGRVAESLVSVINNSVGSVIGDENDYARMDFIRTAIEDGYYGEGDQFIDNAISILDLTGLGMVASRVARPIASAVRMRRNMNSYMDLVKDSNPSKARTAHSAVDADSTDETAEAMSGASRDETIADDLAAEADNEVDAVRSKINGADRVLRTSQQQMIADYARRMGSSALKPHEEAKEYSRIVSDFEHAQGVTARTEMFKIKNVGDETEIKAVYGPSNSGFSDPEEALHSVKQALAKYEIDDDQIRILQKNGGKYEPRTLDEVQAQEDIADQMEVNRIVGRGEVMPVKTGAVDLIKTKNKVLNKGATLAKLPRQPPGTTRVFRATDPGAPVDRQFDAEAIKNLSPTSPKGKFYSEDIKYADEARKAYGDQVQIDFVDIPTDAIKGTNREVSPGEYILDLADRNPNPFRPGDRARIGIAGMPDYLIEVNHRFPTSPFDPETMEVKRNFFDKMGLGLSNKIGSLTRHLVDPASMFDPGIIRSMYAGAERSTELERRLLDMARDYTDPVNAMSTERQNMVTEYLHQANKEGLAFNKNKLIADGFDEDQINAIKKFREFWDTVWFLRNRDQAIHLSKQNWGQFVDENTNTKLIAKTMQKGRLPRNVKVFDPHTNQIRRVAPDEIDDIYDAGGAIARTRYEIPISGEGRANYVVTNKGRGSGELRPITENTEVLAYRQGYYPVQYEDTIFIDRIRKGAKEGEDEVRAWATAGTVEDAKNLQRRLEKTEGEDGVSFRIREAREERSRGDILEDEVDLFQAKGHSAEKVRGERLRGSTSEVDDVGTAGILSPVDTMINEARSISTRVGMKRLLDTYSERIVDQFGDYLPRNPQSGRKMIPNDIREIKFRGSGSPNNKDLGAARSHVEYLKYLQNGYVNQIDDGYKTILRRMSWAAGDAGNQKIERALRELGRGRGPAAMFKNSAFQLYLATNPLRQLLVQSHQATQLAANFPKWVARPDRASAQMSVLFTKEMGFDVPEIMARAAGWTKDEANKAFRQWKDSGLGAGVDKQNLIRESLTDMADRTAGKGFRPLHGMRRIGFDTGELINRATSFLAHRDEAVRAGRNVDDEAVLEDIVGRSSAYTYGMNRSGDMPYNQNALGVVFQFMQVPHKAMLNMLTNRSLTRSQRARLFGFNALMYSLPAAAMSTFFNDVLPARDTTVDIPGLGETNARDLVVNGLQGALMNKALTNLTGEETQLNYRGLAPNDQYGMFEMLFSLGTESPGETLANTPAGTLYFGNDSRLTRLAKDAARFGNFIDDYENPTEIQDVAQSLAEMTSGFSSYFRARQALETQKLYSASGQLTDKDVSKPEAFAQLFGFNTQDEAYFWWQTQDQYSETESFQNDVRSFYNDVKRHIMRDGITPDEYEFQLRVLSNYWKAFGNDNMKAKQILQQEMRRDLEAEDFGLFRQLLDVHGVVDNDTLRGYIRGIPDTEMQNKDELLQVIDDIERVDEVNN